MLAIKLQRVGRKHQPSYRLVVAEARSKMAAPPVEDLGSYHPATKATAFKKDRISYWLGIGAQPTVTAHNLLVAQGVVSTPKRAVKMAKAIKPEAPVAAEKPAEAAVAEVVAAPEASAATPEEPTTSEQPTEPVA
jgi:small subunit ribosomal protein S16